MATVRDVMDRLVAVIESATPDTPAYMGAATFRHLAGTNMSDDALDMASPTRRFLFSPTGGRDVIGTMGAAGSPVEVEQEFALEVLYRSGTSAWEMFKVVTEDVDRVGWQLMRPSDWQQGTTSIYNVTVKGYSFEAPEDANDVGVCTIPVIVHYRPSFTG